MANHKEKTYWPHMIVGFILLAIVLGYWTVKSASSLPVQESNEFMMKYQQADMNINEIMQSKMAFDKSYRIKLLDVEHMIMTDNIHSNRPQANPVKLQKGANHFSYQVTTVEGKPVTDLNVTFLLTRPHTTVDDQMVENVAVMEDRYVTPDLNITKPGRYTLQLRVIAGNKVGYLETEAYLKPE